MKKGMLNIVIFVLIFTNVILTAILVFAIVPAMSSTNDLVSKVALAIDIQKEKEKIDTGTIPINQTEIYNFSEKLTIPLKKGTNTQSNYAVVNVSLSLNTKDPDYTKYKSKLSTNESLMKSEVNTVIMQYTIDEFNSSQDAVLSEILARLRELFDDTTFIYKVSFSSVVTS